MKKKFKLNEIDCANCALKLEESIKEISGVKDAKVNYMMQKLTVEADEADMDGVVEKVLVCVVSRVLNHALHGDHALAGELHALDSGDGRKSDKPSGLCSGLG